MSEMATTLAANKAIDRELDKLILAATTQAAKLAASKMEESQIRNLVNVADHTESLLAVTNFIRYQIGRDPGQDRWGRNGFGGSVIQDIEQDGGIISAALKRVMETKGVAGADEVAVRSRIVALYIGYLNRSFYYMKKTNNWEDLSTRFGEAAASGQGGR